MILVGLPLLHINLVYHFSFKLVLALLMLVNFFKMICELIQKLSLGETVSRSPLEVDLLEVTTNYGLRTSSRELIVVGIQKLGRILRFKRGLVLH